MNITKDVIADLLPLYEAGEASADTRALVDAFMKDHPELAGGRSVDQSLKVAPLPASETSRRKALERTVSLIKRRQFFFALALCFTLMPASFMVSGDEVRWLLWRDAPNAARAFVVAAAVCWVGFFKARGDLRAAGL